MFQKLLCCCLLIGVLTPALILAGEKAPKPVPAVIADDSDQVGILITQYTQSLEARRQSPEQIAEQYRLIQATLRPALGTVLLTRPSFVLVLNSDGWLEAWHENEPVPGNQSLDQYGRLTFTSAEVSANLDIFGSVVILRLELEGQIYYLTGQVRRPVSGGALGSDESSLNRAASGVGFDNATECTCKGSNDKCPDENDCRDANACSHGNPPVNSTCKYLKVPAL